MKHYVVTRRETEYPFLKYWACICDHKLNATVMGPALYKEFAAHNPEED